MVSTATLVYGQTVRVGDLLAAARAHTMLDRTLVGLDWIIHLAKQGSLAVKKKHKKKNKIRKGTIKRVPVEVWGMVCEALIAAEVEAARVSVMGENECEDCATASLMMSAEAKGKEVGVDKDELDDELLVAVATGEIARRQAGQREWAWEGDWIDRAEPDNSCKDHQGIQLETHDHDFDADCYEQLRDGAATDLLASFSLHLPSPKVLQSPDFIKSESSIVVAVKDAPPFGPAAPTLKWTKPGPSQAPALTKFSICPWVLRPEPTLDRRFEALARAYFVGAMPKGLVVDGAEGGARVPADEEEDEGEKEEEEGGAGGEGQDEGGLCEPGWMAVVG